MIKILNCPCSLQDSENFHNFNKQHLTKYTSFASSATSPLPSPRGNKKELRVFWTSGRGGRGGR